MKQKKRPLTLDERKSIQLDMLKEIDAFCKTNEIKYSLAFGTLLGAIRHKGFIPWDDDVDIMMPLPDMLRFKEFFHSKTMKYCDVDTDKYFCFSFARIADTRTINKEGLIHNSYGICIDLYPIVAISDNTEQNVLFFERAKTLEKKCDFFTKWRMRAVRHLPIRTIPFYRSAVRELSDFSRYSFEYGKTNNYYIIAGPISLHEKMTYDFDMFEELIEVEFEKNIFQAISNYDVFLTLRYGDYMTPPPEDQRHPYHGGNYYWR